MANKEILDNLSGQEIREMLNVGNMAIEQLDASALRKLMNYEVDMLCFGEGDMELIERCSALLDELEPNPMSDEDFMTAIQNAKEKHITIIEDDSSQKNVPKKRFILKRIAIVAAAVVILIASTVSVAAAFGVNIFEYINEIVRQPEGTQMDIDGFTFYSSGDVKIYSSIEQLVESEGLDIMYPTKWPEGISIKDVSVMKKSDGKEWIQIFTNDIDTNIQIALSSNEDTTLHSEAIEINGITYYIQKGAFVTASCDFNNNTYYIAAKTLDDVMFMIENMKEK